MEIRNGDQTWQFRVRQNRSTIERRDTLRSVFSCRRPGCSASDTWPRSLGTTSSLSTATSSMAAEAHGLKGSVAVKDGKIAAVGRLPNGTARRVIDARGLTVAPGFIDLHSHSDYTLLVDGKAESKIRQGVTTEILGESESAGPILGPAVPEFDKEIDSLWLEERLDDFGRVLRSPATTRDLRQHRLLRGERPSAHGRDGQC